MAMAPVISELPSPIIGDLDGASGSNHFVFEDAFNLNAFVNDDFSTDGEILWSYETAGAALYSVNNAPVLAGDPVNPGAALITGTDDPDAIDADPFTVTLRDISLSPVGGPDVDPVTPGIVNSQVVTFWASDGSTASSKSTIFYSDNEGPDAFSGGFEPVVSYDFTSGATGWTYREVFDITNNASGAQGAGGLCVTAALASQAIVGFVTDPATPFDLVDNAVYRFRITMSSTAAVGATPILQFVANNTAGTDADGFAYGGEFFIVDAEGGANSIASRAGGEFVWYFSPAQVEVSNWRSATGGAFDAANAALKNFRMEMNVFDVDGVGNAETRAGTVCMTNLNIERADLAALGAGAEVFGIAAGGFSNANFNVAANSFPTLTGTLGLTYGGGNLVVQATASELSLLNLEPGVLPFAADTNHFPIAVTADTTYKISWTVAASAGTNPIEIIRLNADLPTNEIIQNGFAAASGAGLGVAALPTGGGAAETYNVFFSTHSSTLSGGLPANWRPSLTIANRQDVNGSLGADNALTFSGVSVVPLN
jgi:hypothetical protein